MRPRKINWLFGYLAVGYAAGLLLATGLVPDWGAWFSTSLPYRMQTEALLKGDLAVSRSVAKLKSDHTWSEQGVHQVWGLGVPLWRLPFEAVAKLFGFDGFPDRIAFGLFALLVCFVVLKVWVSFGDEKSEVGDGWNSGWRMITGFGAGLIIMLLFPPFLTLLRVRGAVWEEAVAYEYLFGILQVTLLVAFARQPTIARLLLVSALAGFGGLIRPTLVFYGFATMLIVTGVWVFKIGQTSNGLSPVSARSQHETARTSIVSPGGYPASSNLGRVLTPTLLPLFIFCLGGGLLWFTNLKRFGDGFEFGHKLNVQTFYGSVQATRFDNPFQDEPLTGAAKELFGALFLVEKFNGADYYRENIFPGKSKTVRWREFYFRTYDWSYLSLLLLGWGAAVAAGFKFRVSSFGLSRLSNGAPVSELAMALGDTRPGPIPYPPAIVVLGLWSLLAVIPLAGFYLYAPVISSRYMMDLAPAFAAALAAAWLFLAARCTTRSSRVLVCLTLCAWLAVQVYLSRYVYRGPASVTAAELKASRESRRAIGGSTTNHYTADDYGQSLNGNHSRIPFDRDGWNAETGAVMPLVILFVKDAVFLELDFATQPHPRIPPAPAAIRAKVGLEFLERVRITEIDGGWRVRFRGPQQPRWRDGLQGAFIATVPKEFLTERSTPWLLKAVRWRAAAADEDAIDRP